MEKNISLIGNCQTTALCKFLRQLKYNAKWLCFETEWINSNWPKNQSLFQNQIQHNIFDQNDCVNFLKISDIIIFQPNYLHCNVVDNYKNDTAQTITLSPVFVNNLDYILEKESKYQTNVKISSIISQYPKEKLYVINDNHLSTLLTLEILKQIANLANLQFFDNITYQELIKIQYPNY